MLMNFFCSTIFGIFACDTLPPPNCHIEPETGLEVCLQPVEPTLPPVNR